MDAPWLSALWRELILQSGWCAMGSHWTGRCTCRANTTALNEVMQNMRDGALWAGSFVQPWLYRACIKHGGRPGDCSDD